jgi:hypothetical protein
MDYKKSVICSPEHQGNLKFYCHTEKMAICVECYSTHVKNGHSIIPIDFHFQTKLDQLKFIYEDIRVSETMKEQIEKLQGKIQKMFGRLVQDINKLCERTLIEVEELIKASTQNHPRVEGIQAKLEAKIKEIDSLLKKHSYIKLMQSISDEEILDFQSECKKSKNVKMPIKLGEYNLNENHIRQMIPIRKGNVLPESDHNMIHFLEQYSQNLYLYDIKEKKSRKIQIKRSGEPLPYKSFSSVRANGRIFIFGGRDQKDKITYKTTLEFVHEHEHLLRRTDMPNEKDLIRTIPIKNRMVYCIGGLVFEPTTYFNTCEKYDIDNDTWAKVPSLNESKHSPGVCSFQDKEIYSFGGYGGKFFSSVEKLDLNNEHRGWVWIKIKSGEGWVPTHLLLAIPIKNNQILLFGGSETGDESFIFDTGEARMHKHKKLGQSAKVYSFHPPTIYNNHVYGLFDDKSIHVYSINEQTWNVIPHTEWMP